MYKKRPAKSNRRSVFIGVLVAALLIVAVFVSFKQIFGTTSTIPSTKPGTTNETKAAQGTIDKQNNSTSNDSGTTSGEKSSSGTTTSNATLLAPSGSFVSNHRPSLSSTGSPSSEQSVCNTTPGASCEIRFTKGNDVKKLPAQVADSNGSTYWNWSVNPPDPEFKFSIGTWNITAYASLNGKTLSTSDAMGMEVGQ